MNNNRYDTVIRLHFSSEKEAMEYYADQEKFYKRTIQKEGLQKVKIVMK